MWQLLKVLWGKVAGQLPSAPSKMPPDLLGKVPVQQPSPQKAPAAETTPKPTWEAAAPKVMAAQRGEEPRELLRSPDAEAGESGIGPAQPTSTAKSISNLWGMGDSGSRISRIAAASNSSLAVSSIARAAGPIIDR